MEWYNHKMSFAHKLYKALIDAVLLEEYKFLGVNVKTGWEELTLEELRDSLYLMSIQRIFDDRYQAKIDKVIEYIEDRIEEEAESEESDDSDSSSSGTVQI